MDKTQITYYEGVIYGAAYNTETLLITALSVMALMICFDKWKLDERLKNSAFFSRFWFKGNACYFCISFWLSVICFLLLVFVPMSILVLEPLAAAAIVMYVSSAIFGNHRL